MRIEGHIPVQRAAAGKAGGAKRTDGFASLVGPSKAGSAAASAPAQLVGGVFAVEDDSDAATGRSRGLSAGHDLLDELEGLRRALLLGSVNGSRLKQIADKLDRMPIDADDRLGAIGAEIRLRVAVEIAKLSPAHLAACRSLARPV